MKLYFENASELNTGIGYLADDLGFSLCKKEAADCIVTVNTTEKDEFKLKFDGTTAKITYGGGKTRFFKALAILVDAIKNNNSVNLTQSPTFKSNGAMVDMSRNAVMNVKTVKFMLRKLALMGMNTFMLYTEDTYEIDSQEFFGHLRGRYTKDEIRELDAYALDLGIELVPCIQMLGHLATFLKNPSAAPVKDTANVLLAGADATYALIDDMLKTVTETFTTKKIHIGMDETKDVGRGAYLSKFGYRHHRDIYFEHLAKVIDMIKGYGLQPMMWSDMFFRMYGETLDGYKEYDVRVEFPDDIATRVPQGVRQVFWDYYNPGYDFYAINIDKHKLLGEDTLFAGGVWCWSGFATQYSRSIRNSVPALKACKDKAVKDVFATVWHNGSECTLIMSLAGLALYSDFDYSGKYDEQSVAECFRVTCNADYYEFLKTEDIEYPHGDNLASGISRMLMYNDPLTGKFDYHIAPYDTKTYYTNLSKELDSVGNTDNIYKPAFDVVKAISSLFENKADFGVRLKSAFDNGDRQALSNLADECDTIIEKLVLVKTLHKKSWMLYNKAFGWEVHDIRYGGLICRFETAKELIKAYLTGEIPEIEELTAKRLRLDGKTDTDPYISSRFLWLRYGDVSTSNVL